jgi:CPA1 family monovalent cation:H+ antiporter
MVLTVVTAGAAGRRFRLPHTVLLAIASMTASWFVAGDIKPAPGRRLRQARQARGRHRPVLPFLPPLLFTAGLTIDVRRLFDEVAAVLLLAIVAVFVCIGVVGGAVHVVTGIDIFVCLLLGTIVSTTDPAAVIGILREVGAPKRFPSWRGQSLLNDAVAIAASACSWASW